MRTGAFAAAALPLVLLHFNPVSGFHQRFSLRPVGATDLRRSLKLSQTASLPSDGNNAAIPCPPESYTPRRSWKRGSLQYHMKNTDNPCRSCSHFGCCSSLNSLSLLYSTCLRCFYKSSVEVFHEGRINEEEEERSRCTLEEGDRRRQYQRVNERNESW